MSIRLAEAGDFPSLLRIYQEARAFMKARGNPAQWGESHPSSSFLQEDLVRGELYVLYDREGLYGAFSLNSGEDPTYLRIEGRWRSSSPYLTIHSLASDGTHKSVFKEVLAFALARSRHLRIDTHEANALMRKLILENGFVYTGRCLEPDGSERLCYERF
jgi:hypothetical protein